MASSGEGLDNILKRNLKQEDLREFNRIYYGREDHNEVKLKQSTVTSSTENNFEVSAYSFTAAKEIREPRIVKLGLIQHSIVLTTDKPINEQREAIFDKVAKIIETAASEGVNIICLQEAWSIPFFLCTGEREKWADFAESAKEGPSITFLSQLAKKFKMVIVSPILEDDNGIWWNTAVVIDENGKYLGKHKKNHLPSVGTFSELAFYSPGNSGHPVFETKFGKVAVNICYGRHHALNWLMFALNGADIVFNPAATVADFGETFWAIEARNAAIANNYFTCSINRVGIEKFTKKDGSEVSRNFYGSSYATAPNGYKTPSLSRGKDGLLIIEMDLNLCRQVKDMWGFNMTSRLEIYAKELQELFEK